ncbi:thymidine phosphorylase [Spirochaetota bacterium]
MRAVDIIVKKRNGEELSREELAAIINGYVDGSIPDYQASAWLMAVLLRGMSFRETANLTELMLRSGSVMDLSGIAGPFVDKHSTGGVGDKTSLILAPIVAACGVKVPMMSGRALGHTGGTLDKLDSIPGYTTALDEQSFREYLAKDGFAMTGQTDSIVPADKKLYALRDVSGTVESVPLITASILSKKVAEGSEALVFDVKSGQGAFMKTLKDAEELANSLVKTGEAMGKRIIGVITDMSEPLGNKVGNFFEVEESMDCLQGRGPDDLMEVTLRLAAWMLVAGGAAGDVEEGLEKSRQAINSGKAYELFIRNVKTQGGNTERLLKLKGNYRSKHARELRAQKDGFIQSIDAYKIGMAGVQLGVGRNKTSDPVEPDVGFIFERKKGAKVKAGEVLCQVYGKSEASLHEAWDLVSGSVTIGNDKPVLDSLIIKEIGAV